MWHVRSPGKVVVIAAYALVALAFVIVVAALQMPSVGVSFAEDGAQIDARAADGRTLARIDPATTVQFRSSGGSTTWRADELLPDYAPTGTPAQIAAWYARHDQLTRIARAPPVVVAIAGARPLVLHAPPRVPNRLSIDVWLLLAQGCAVGLLGLWLSVVRPRDLGARLFFISCAGITLAAFSGAMFDARELTAGGTLLQVMQALNFIGSNVAAAGMVGLYLCQPARLVRPWLPVALIVVAAALGTASGLGWLPLSAFYAGLLIALGAFVVVLVVQWIHSRRDPAARAALRWVGVTTLAGTGSLSVMMAMPQFLGGPSLGGDGMSFIPVFIVYGSIAFGIGRSRLFDIDRWTYRIILGAAATIGLLALDALLIGGLGIKGRTAFVLALLVIGFLYLPARLFVWQHIVGRPAMTDSELFQTATAVAFAPSAAARRAGWRALLNKLFDPLHIETGDAASVDPEIDRQGNALAIPAAADESALILRHRDGGRKLFGPAEVVLAREVVALMRRAETTRDEYARGVAEERQRIARDLHDDVGARLLTGLHRDDVVLVRGDIRQAMADIRTIISSLAGDQIALDRVMADLRFETAGRLAAAKIDLDWALPVDPFAAHDLDYTAYKGLTSSHREIISNILKHSGARSVVVTAHAADDVLHIDVRDDGCGIADPRDGGHGLANIRQRITDLRGGFTVTPRAPGTQVTVSIPLR